MIFYNILQTAFFIYSNMILVRCVASWLPELESRRWMRFLIFYVDPYLNFFRRWIPLIAGRIDISPIAAFITLRILEKLILNILIA